MSNKNKNQQGTGSVLSTGKEFNRDMVPDALKIIESKIEALKGDKEKTARITGTLGQFGRISDIQDVMLLRAAYGYITSKVERITEHDEVFKNAAPTVKVGTYKEGGFTVDQWCGEILSQYKEVVYKEELTKLMEAKKLLEENLSEELKFAAKMKAVADLLSIQE